MTQIFNLYLFSIFIKHFSLVFKEELGLLYIFALKVFARQEGETTGNKPCSYMIVKVQAYL